MTVPEPVALRLAADFPAASMDEWQRLALGVLRKAGRADANTPPEAVEELLGTTTYDGIQLKPLYTAANAAPPTGPLGRGTPGGWDVRQRHADPDPQATNQAILADLENGVTSIWLSGFAPAQLPAVLDGVHLDLVDIVLESGTNPRSDPDTGRQTDPADAQHDAEEAAELLLGLGLQRGNLGAQHPGKLLKLLRDLPGVRAMTVDGTPFHDAGGSDAEELGFAVATGVQHLRELTDAGLSVGMAFGQLEFRFAATADQFATIAKLRAARRLWARVAQVSGVPELGTQRQHAVTSSAMMTARDPWVNLLRTTLACFGAGVGGADAVTVQPFDTRLGLPDGFSRRIARNTQSLLIEEANVARVLDPAGGSWFVESLTDALANAAWDIFVEVERGGGMPAALGSGLVADRLAATWQRRTDNVAHRRDPITGVSEFPNLDERRPVRSAAPPGPSGALPRRWYGQDFEILRDRAEAATAAGAPTVWLATLGPIATHTARTEFAANLFAAGGIRSVRCGPEADFSGVRVACICGSDVLYAEQAENVAAALKAAGATTVWLAGKPATYAGVDGYLFTGCDAVRVLQQTQDDLGVAA